MAKWCILSCMTSMFVEIKGMTIEQENLLEGAVLIERTSCNEERIWRDVRLAQDEDLHYFSTLIVRKK